MPQGSSCECKRTGKTGLRKAFPVPDGARPRANPVCPFASYSLCRAYAGSGFRPHGVPWRAAKCREDRLSAFILHFPRHARLAYYRPVPVPRPFTRFSQGLPWRFDKVPFGDLLLSAGFLASSRQEAADATETCKRVPKGRLSSLPGIAEIYSCPHRISTEPLLHGGRGEGT